MSEWSVVRYQDGERYAVALVAEGRTKLGVIAIADRGIGLRKVDKTEGRYCTPVLRKGHPYEPDRCARKFLRAGRRLGIGKRARKILKAIAGSQS